MPEAVLSAALAMLLLAAASHRFRRDSGIAAAQHVRAVRIVAVVLLAVAWWRCSGGLDGERIVRFVVCVSIAAVPVVLMLSAASAAVFAPLRRLTGRRPR